MALALAPDARMRRRKKGHGYERPGGGASIGMPAFGMEEVVKEVATRVARRLQMESRKEQIADQLAGRIMKRLTK